MSESVRFDMMLNNISTHLPYKKLIENGNKNNEFPDDRANANRWLEAKQGSFGF